MECRDFESSINLVATAQKSDLVITYSPVFTQEGSEILSSCIGEVIVLLAEGKTEAELETLLDKYGFSISQRDPYVKNQYVVAVSEKNGLVTLDAANLLYETGLFEFAEPNFFLSNANTSSDPLYPNQWGLKNTGQEGGTAGVDINAQEAWGITTGTPNIVIALVDVGVQLDHPDLVDNLVEGYDASDTTIGGNTLGAPFPTSASHGTLCAGIVGAVQNNNIMITGVASSCKIMPICIEKNYGTTVQWYSNGINYASSHGADVISLSYLSGKHSSVNCAIKTAQVFGRGGKGCVVVFASGNGNKSQVEYPSNLDGVIAVGGVDRCGQRSGRLDVVENPCDPWSATSFPGSSYGTKLSVVAPGTNVYTTTVNSSYVANFGGTSAACPHVAGVAALMLSVNPHLHANQVKNIIEMTAQKVGDYTYTSNYQHPNGSWNKKTGYGMVNAGLAVQMAQMLVLHPDLYVKDNNDDDGHEGNITTTYWNRSPDIWLTEGNVIVKTPVAGHTYTVNVKVRNRGAITSTDATMTVRWALLGSAPTWKSSWTTVPPLCGMPRRGIVTLSCPVGTVSAYDSTILSFTWTAPNYATSLCGNGPLSWGLSFCAVLDDGNTVTGLDNDNLSMDVFTSQNNNVAWRNYTLQNPNIGPMLGTIDNHLSVSPTPITLRFAPRTAQGGQLLSDHTTIHMRLSPELYQAWAHGGLQGTNVVYEGGNTVRFTSPYASMDGLILDTASLYWYTLTVDHPAYDEMHREPIEWDMTQLCLIYDEIDSVMGVTTFDIAVCQQNSINVTASASDICVVAGDNLHLTAESDASDAEFSWYTNGTAVGQGAAVDIIATNTQQYILQGYSSLLDAMGTDTLTVNVYNGIIRGITPNPASGQTTVEYRLADGVTGATLSITTAMGLVLYSASLDSSATAVDVNLQGYTAGQYIVRIDAQGTLLEMKTLMVY